MELLMVVTLFDVNRIPTADELFFKNFPDTIY